MSLDQGGGPCVGEVSSRAQLLIVVGLTVNVVVAAVVAMVSVSFEGGVI